MESDKWCLNGWLEKMAGFFFFENLYTSFTGKTNRLSEKDNTNRKYSGHIAWVRELGLILCKEDLPDKYKI
jgi:hypothetical protein